MMTLLATPEEPWSAEEARALVSAITETPRRLQRAFRAVVDRPPLTVRSCVDLRSLADGLYRQEFGDGAL